MSIGRVYTPPPNPEKYNALCLHAYALLISSTLQRENPVQMLFRLQGLGNSWLSKELVQRGTLVKPSLGKHSVPALSKRCEPLWRKSDDHDSGKCCVGRNVSGT